MAKWKFYKFLPLAIALFGAIAYCQTLPNGRIAPEKLYKDYNIPDSTGQACVNCHSPLGIELAAFDFSNSDFHRRVSLHFDEQTAQRLANSLIQYRGQLGGEWFASSSAPLQPGNTVLPGANPMARDESFLNEISSLCPRLERSPIQSLLSAKEAANSILAVDLDQLKIGIQMNQLSEDSFHGKSHATIADWFSDIPIPGHKLLLPAMEECQANPSFSNFKKLDHDVENQIPRDQLSQIAVDKYRSLLTLSFSLYKNGKLGNDCSKIKFFNDDNPFWNLGKDARTFQDSNAKQLNIPADVLAKKSEGISISDQIKSMVLPWLWLGWMKDPSLEHSGIDAGTRSGDYLCKEMWKLGPYPVHTLFAMQRRMLERWAYPQNWRKNTSTHFELNYSYLLLEGRLPSALPKVPIERKKAIDMYENCFRMSLLLLKDDVQRSGFALRPFAQVNQIRIIKKLFEDWKSGSEDILLCDRVVRLLQNAKPILR